MPLRTRMDGLKAGAVVVPFKNVKGKPVHLVYYEERWSLRLLVIMAVLN